MWVFKGPTVISWVFEAINVEGLKQILRSRVGHTSFCAGAWARLSCCIQISVQMILNRETDDLCGLGVSVGVGVHELLYLSPSGCFLLKILFFLFLRSGYFFSF